MDTSFFEKWSPNMAYILGYIFADGCLLKTRYRLKISSCDKNHLKKILCVIKSNYPILLNRRADRKIPNYDSIVDSKKVYFDLLKLGLIPRKSKVVKFPNIPKKYFFDFLRGYLDGDGSVYYDRPHIDRGDNEFIRLNTCFTSGSYNFLNAVQRIISKRLNIPQQKLSQNRTAFKLRYSTQDSLKLLEQVYKNNNRLLKLSRKYKKYLDYVLDKRKRA